MSEELKPCPFCGASAEYRWGYARCADLSCAGWHWVEIAAWNTRSAPAVQVPDGYRLQPHSEFDAMNAFIRGETKVPPGYSLVPVEPTPEMLEAIANTVPCMTSDARHAYPALLAAAPAAPVATEARRERAIPPGMYQDAEGKMPARIGDPVALVVQADPFARQAVATEAVARQSPVDIALDGWLEKFAPHLLDGAGTEPMAQPANPMSWDEQMDSLGELAEAHPVGGCALPRRKPVAQGGGVDVEKVMALVGFDREALEGVAEALETGYEQRIGIGNVTGEGDEFLPSAPAAAARIIHALLTAAPAGTGAVPEYWMVRTYNGSWKREYSAKQAMAYSSDPAFKVVPIGRVDLPSELLTVTPAAAKQENVND